jgi:hypothetical protein
MATAVNGFAEVLRLVEPAKLSHPSRMTICQEEYGRGHV